MARKYWNVLKCDGRGVIWCDNASFMKHLYDVLVRNFELSQHLMLISRYHVDVEPSEWVEWKYYKPIGSSVGIFFNWKGISSRLRDSIAVRITSSFKSYGNK